MSVKNNDGVGDNEYKQANQRKVTLENFDSYLEAINRTFDVSAKNHGVVHDLDYSIEEAAKINRKFSTFIQSLPFLLASRNAWSINDYEKTKTHVYKEKMRQAEGLLNEEDQMYLEYFQDQIKMVDDFLANNQDVRSYLLKLHELLMLLSDRDFNRLKSNQKQIKSRNSPKRTYSNKVHNISVSTDALDILRAFKEEFGFKSNSILIEEFKMLLIHKNAGIVARDFFIKRRVELPNLYVETK
jgi:hypothetical protein